PVFRRLRGSFGLYAGSLAFLPDGKTLIVGGQDRGEGRGDPGGVLFLDLALAAGPLSLPGGGKPVAVLTFAPDGRTLAGQFDPPVRLGTVEAARIAGTEVRLWQAATGRELAALVGPVAAHAFSPDGRTLVLASAAAGGWLVREWDTTSGRPRDRLCREAGP